MTWRFYLLVATVTAAFAVAGVMTLGSTQSAIADHRDCPKGQSNSDYCDDDDEAEHRRCPSRTINGTDRNDVLVGTRRSERIRGRGGDDDIDGRAGNDCLLGHRGDDDITGGRGRDLIWGGRGDDDIFANDDQRDRIKCGRGKDSAVVDEKDDVSDDCEDVTER